MKKITNTKLGIKQRTLNKILQDTHQTKDRIWNYSIWSSKITANKETTNFTKPNTKNSSRMYRHNTYNNPSGNDKVPFH